MPSIHTRPSQLIIRRARKGDPQALCALRDARSALLERHIIEVINSTPPLTDEQKSRLMVLLNPTKDAV